jgi:flagellar motor switch protein FliG
VLRHLDEAQVEAIMRAMIELGPVHGDELQNLIKTGDRTGVIPEREIAGGPDVAREMLAAAFGPEAGERIFFRAVPNAPAHHFAFVNDLEPVQLRNVLRDEAPAAVALILAHVERPLAAAVMNELEPGARADVARRIARMGRLSRDVVVRVEEALREKVRRQASDVAERVEGTETLAAILRHMNPSEGDSILRGLREESVDLEGAIRSRLYTVDLLRNLAPRHLADLVRDLENDTIALFLRGKDEALRALVLRALSDRRAELVSEEYAHMGPQPREKVDEATQAVLERLRSLEADGTILVPREGDRYI